MTEQDLDIVADALVTLSQAPLTATVVSISHNAAPSGRSRRDRKPPARLTSGDYVCDVNVSKDSQNAAPHPFDGSALEAYQMLDLSYTKHALKNQQRYSYEHPPAKPSNFTSTSRTFPGKRKQQLSAHNQFAEDLDVFYHIAKKLRGMGEELYSQDFLNSPSSLSKAGKRPAGDLNHSPTVVQVFAGSVPDHTDADLLDAAHSMLVWDANMYIVPRCPAVRGALKSPSLVGIGTH